MSDSKSKLPDIKEITSIASKLFKDLRKSVEEIVQDFKHKRASETETHKESHTTTHKSTTKTSHEKPEQGVHSAGKTAHEHKEHSKPAHSEHKKTKATKTATHEENHNKGKH